MSTIGVAWKKQGADVVVASGPAMAPRIHEDGFRYEELVLGPGSNAGTLDLNVQTQTERSSLEAFLKASRRGMTAVLEHQARSRLRDLLWEPERVARQIDSILVSHRPDLILADFISFNTTLALRALDCPYVSLLPAHPSSLAVEEEVYGFPPYWPSAIPVDESEALRVRNLCRAIEREFTDRFNEALLHCSSAAQPVENAFRAVSPSLTLLMYPEMLARRRSQLPHNVRFIGALPRRQVLPEDVAAQMRAQPTRPRVYVTLGSFLSHRRDLLNRVVRALSALPVNLVLATGVHDAREWSDVDCLARRFWPQVPLLDECDLVISHGGNNTVTEALSAGLPQIIAPLSTDQFAGAADVERAGLGLAVDPNGTSVRDWIDRVETALAPSFRRRAKGIARILHRRPGANLSVSHMLASIDHDAEMVVDLDHGTRGAKPRDLGGSQ